MCRYAIGYAERSGPKAHIGWLASLANATDQPYTANNTGGPTIKVKKSSPPAETKFEKIIILLYFVDESHKQ